MIQLMNGEIKIKGKASDIFIEFIELISEFKESEVFSFLKILTCNDAKLMDIMQKIESLAESINKLHENKLGEKEYNEFTKFHQIRLRIEEKPEILQKFINFLKNSNLVKILQDSKEYPNRNSIFARRYLTIEFPEVIEVQA